MDFGTLLAGLATLAPTAILLFAAYAMGRDQYPAPHYPDPHRVDF